MIGGDEGPGDSSSTNRESMSALSPSNAPGGDPTGLSAKWQPMAVSLFRRWERRMSGERSAYLLMLLLLLVLWGT
jgi:hypothetical protein